MLGTLLQSPWLGEGSRNAGRGTQPLPLQVADERFCPDVLSTAKEMSVANFRRVPKMPIYGTAQPSSKVRGAHPVVGRVARSGLPALPSPLPTPSLRPWGVSCGT